MQQVKVTPMKTIVGPRSAAPSRDVPRPSTSSSPSSTYVRAVASVLFLVLVVALFGSSYVFCVPLNSPSLPLAQLSSLSPSTSLLEDDHGVDTNNHKFIENEFSSFSNDSFKEIVHGGPEEGKPHNKPIIIGYLTNLYGRQTSTRQGLVISGAISYAVNYINNNLSDRLNQRPLKFIYNDTSASSLNSTAALISQWKSNAVAFFGPEDTCEVEATIAAAINLPMISYKCANSAVSNKVNFPTFARTHPPDVIVVRSILALLKYFQWHKFGIVWYKSSPKFAPVVATLRLEAELQQFAVTVDYPFEDEVQCCIKKETCCGKIWSELVEKTYRHTRIYVFFGGGQYLPHFLLALNLRGLLDHGEYIVISAEIEEDYIEEQTYRFIDHRTDRPPHETHAIHEASRSVFVIARSPPESPDYSKFVEKVRMYNKLPPFSLVDRMDGLKRHITSYAAYLYDAVILYVDALSQAFKDGYTEYDGKEIIQRIIQRRRYQSVTGAWMHIDQNGDVQGNYTVLQTSFTRRKYTRSVAEPAESDNAESKPPNIYMFPVGIFQFDDKTNETTFSQTGSIEWVKPGHVPLDEPPCGFDNRSCNKGEANIREILMGILVSILVITCVMISIAYRSWKYEQEIDGLLWKISREDIRFDDDKAKILSSSRASLISNSSLTRAKINDDTVTKLATYKGAVVSIKEYRFDKAKKSSGNNAFDYLSRDDKKEMKYMKEMHHKNINPFIGACTHPDLPTSVFIVSEYCSKGSMKDVFENEELKLEEDFLSSLIYGIMSGIAYLHKSEIKCHGNLKSSNCLVTSRWVLKLTDFGLHRLRRSAETVRENTTGDMSYDNLWKAPELLRDPDEMATPECDIYAFGIIIHEMIVRKGPFGIKRDTELTENQLAEQIIQNVKRVPIEGSEYRPDTSEIEVHNDVIEIMKSCWREDPRARPTIEAVRGKFKTCQKFKPPANNIMDSMMKLMENYQNQLEDLVDKRTQQLNEEKRKTETLLHRMLPESVAQQLIQGEMVVPESFDAVTIFFSDIVGFTSLSAASTPMEVVTFLNDLYILFDSIISNYDVYKVETIGDAYMVVSGLPIRNGDKHCTEIASMALEMLEGIHKFRIRHRPKELLQLRIGIHTGPVVAGVVGLKMPRYCLFGDTVNTASRMESNGEALRIHISPECRDRLEPTNKYIIEERGLVNMKGKGDIRTYWLKGHKDGTKPRHKAVQINKSDSPWMNKDKQAKPHITFLDDEFMFSARKGSLVPLDKGHFPANPNSLYKKSLIGRNALTQSVLRLKSNYSNSCNTFSDSSAPLPEPHTSPKPNRRNWNFKLLNGGKVRSMSHNHPADAPANHISLKETKSNQSKPIIKSPSYNTIESLSQRINSEFSDSEVDSEDGINLSANPLTRSHFDGSLIEESSLCEVPIRDDPVHQFGQSPATREYHPYKPDEFADECEENQPLLGKHTIYRLSSAKNSLTRQISLAEEDEDIGEDVTSQSEPNVNFQTEPHDPHDNEPTEMPNMPNGSSPAFLHPNCDMSAANQVTGSPRPSESSCTNAADRSILCAAGEDTISANCEEYANGNGSHLQQPSSPSDHRSTVGEFVCLDIEHKRRDSFYYDSHLVGPASSNNGTGVKSTV